jgi:peptide/nickel transport system ATP-binding protein
MLYLHVKHLKISTQEKELLDISFKINTSTALIGESGSGKSLTLKALLDLLPQKLIVDKKLDSNFQLDFNSIGFIPQNPFTSLSPMTKIGNQFFCDLEKKINSLKLVDLPTNVLDKFPSQLSGGQVQRVVIAIALSRDIKILLLDEPTTALDKENRDNIINLIKQLKDKLNILILFVSHDIESIKDICDDILIIKNGKLIEEGLTKSILDAPSDDYTKVLIDSNFKNKKFRT